MGELDGRLDEHQPDLVRAVARPVVEGLPSEAEHAATYARLYDWAVHSRENSIPADCVRGDAARGGQS